MVRGGEVISFQQVPGAGGAGQGPHFGDYSRRAEVGPQVSVPGSVGGSNTALPVRQQKTCK